MTKPSDFVNIQPWDSVFQKSEYETTASCIMKLLANTGDTWRELTYEEYVKAQPNANEKRFKEVIKYFKSADTVRLFSKSWDI